MSLELLILICTAPLWLPIALACIVLTGIVLAFAIVAPIVLIREVWRS